VEEASPPGSAKFMDRLIIRGVYGRVRWRNNGFSLRIVLVGVV